VQASQDGFDPAAFLLQGSTTREVNLEGQEPYGHSDA
jgi:hypothetical protein